VAKEVDFGNMPDEKERLQDLVAGIHFQSVDGSAVGNDKRMGYDQAKGAKKLRMPTHEQIPVKAGGPYLCDSDSDVTAPMTMVEELEGTEGWNK
jgi:hypothetical protein